MIGMSANAPELRAIADELGATEAQTRLAYRRALSRTASNLATMMRRDLRRELDLRGAATIRRRLRTMRPQRRGDGESVTLWLGENDLPPGAIRGRPRETADGVTFWGQSFPGAFIARMASGKVSIYKRRADGRLPIIEQTVHVKDRMDEVLERRVMPDVMDIFFRNFRADLRARTQFGAGR